jgi:hypothetical protein
VPTLRAMAGSVASDLSEARSCPASVPIVAMSEAVLRDAA